MYRDGYGVMPDLREAERWLQRSAEQENVAARIALGSLDADRLSPIQNDVKALMWFNFAVVLGSREAASLREGLLMRMTPTQMMEAQRLGREYKSENDYKKMARNLKPKAKSGNAPVQMKLGILYYKEQGVSRDYSEAARLFLLAAEKGDPYAQSNLAYMCEHGEGIPQNDVLALMYYTLAAANGDVRATTERDRLMVWMIPAQVDEAQRRAREFKMVGK